MGQNNTQPPASLALFQHLFSNANWISVTPGENSLADAEDSGPEACFRMERSGQIFEASFHAPLEQICIAVGDREKFPSLKLFFFYRDDLEPLVQALLSIDDNIDLHDLNKVLSHTDPHCLFTLLELPGEGLFEVAKQPALV